MYLGLDICASGADYAATSDGQSYLQGKIRRIWRMSMRGAAACGYGQKLAKRESRMLRPC